MNKRVIPIGAAMALAATMLAGCDRSPEKSQPNRNLPAIQAETLHAEVLKPEMQPHWVWVNDVSFDRPLDGRAYLIDGDNGHMLGMVSGGYVQGPLQLSPDRRGFAQVSTFYSRGVRGERTDVVTEYDMANLSPVKEVVIPPKTLKASPLFAAAALSDDGRFLIASNFTPAQSVSVVDRQASKLVGEFDTPGCGLVYPTGPRSFMVHCSDGGLTSATLDDSGKVTLGKVGKPISTANDPVMEKPVRIGATKWLFVTFEGHVKVVDSSSGTPTLVSQWPLSADKGGDWRPGGLAPLVYHRLSGELFVLMHKGGAGTHKEPGTQIWVYDIAQQKRLRIIDLKSPASALGISPDGKPLLYAVLFGEDGLSIYDPKSGELLRKVTDLSHTLSLVQPPQEKW